ncbi:hypothetical protein MBLNU230_g1252t1 [Neophaeotheca triangularis]
MRCVYSPRAPRQKTRSRRGAVISQYKQEVAGSKIAVHSSEPEPKDPECSHIPEGPQYTKQFFLDLIPGYEASVYPTHPVVSPAELRTLIGRIDNDQEAKAFIFATGAITISLSSGGNNPTPLPASQAHDLIETARVLCRPVGMSYKASVPSILTSLFIHHCLYDQGEFQSAFLYIRHALSMLELLRVRETASDPSVAGPEALKRHRLYWLLFIQERFMAMSEYKNVVLLPLPFIAERAPEMPESIHEYFLRLIKLFSLVDSTFVQGWLTQYTGAEHQVTTAAWMRRKCEEILRDAEEAEQERERLDSMQLADLTITRHWLATHVWRMAMSTGHLKNLGSEEYLTLFFPVQLADRLRQEVTTYSFESIEIHGTGIAQKLFELTDTLADLVLHVPPASLGEYADRIDLLTFLLRMTFRSAMLDATRKAILEDKLHRIYSLDLTINSS